MGGNYFFVLYLAIFFTYTTSSFFAQTNELTSYKNALTQLDFSNLIWKALWILNIIHCSIIKHGFWFFVLWINPLLGVNAFHINYIYGYMNKWKKKKQFPLQLMKIQFVDFWKPFMDWRKSKTRLPKVCKWHNYLY